MVVVAFTTSTYAQTDAKAKAILAEVSKKYKSYNIVKTDFSFTLDNPKAKVKETQQKLKKLVAKYNKEQEKKKEKNEPLPNQEQDQQKASTINDYFT